MIKCSCYKRKCTRTDHNNIADNNRQLILYTIENPAYTMKVQGCITVILGVVSEHTALGCHWLVAGVDCALLGQFVHIPAVDSLLELQARCESGY